MPLNRYTGYSLRNRIFVGFLIICILSTVGSTIVSYVVLKRHALELSKTDQQKKSDALMASLDYAVSQEELQSEDLPRALGNKIYEISDINKTDLVIYDLKGEFLVSNKEKSQISSKKLDKSIVQEVLEKHARLDTETYDENLQANVLSSYMVLKNNNLLPIGVVYYPYYHSDTVYLNVFNKYLQYIIFINLVIVFIAIFISWKVSMNLTATLTKFSELLNKLTLFERDLKPIRYYKNDELNSLVNSYNKMIIKIQDQKERLAFTEKEQAWREMAKQVAHEVKNPLTPMKLTIQNFKRKFDPTAPDITAKVNQMCDTVVDQIDLVATVASAFSQFAQLPKKNNEIFNLNSEVKQILRIFNDENVFLHINTDDIMINMDRIYLSRILTNLITNAQQAAVDDRKSIISVDIEKKQKRITITVEDNGMGIPPEMLDRIFEPNFTSKSSGMGLGLAMVRKMIHDYRGEISVQSEVGSGTKFTITLPSNL